MRLQIFPRFYSLLFALGLIFVQMNMPLEASAAGNFLCSPSSGTNSQSDVSTCVNRIYKFSIIAGSIGGVFLIVIAGYLYMFSGGDQNKASTAKSLILSSLTGIIILLSGLLILKQINPSLLLFKKISPEGTTKMDWPEWNPYVGSGESSGDEKPATGTTARTTGNFPNFKQTAAPWGTQIYGNCKPSSQSTVGTSGCGPSSLANVIKFYQEKGKATSGDVNPGIIAKMSSDAGYRVCGSGTSYTMFPAIANKYGLKAQNNVSWAAAEAALKQGIPVIAAMGKGYFTGGGHFVVLYGIDSKGEILVSDSGPRNIASAPLNITKSQQHFLTIIIPK